MFPSEATFLFVLSISLFVSTEVSLISTVTVERFYSRVRLFPSQHDDLAKLLLLLLLRLFSRPCSLSFRVSTITDCFIRLQSAGIAGTAPTIANRFDWHETARSAVPTDSPVFRPRFRGAFFDGRLPRQTITYDRYYSSVTFDSLMLDK